MAKRGIIVSYYFPPAGGGGVQRWTKFIKYLSRRDWTFSVVCATPESQRVRDNALSSEIPDSTAIIRTKNDVSVRPKKHRESRYWERWLSALVHGTDSRKAWNSIAEHTLSAAMNENDFDVIIFTIPPYSLAGLAARLSIEQAVPVVLDMRDPWTRNPYKIYPTRLHRRFDENAEKAAIRNIRHFSFAYQSTLQDYKQDKLIRDQADHVIIPNGFDEEDFSSLSADRTISEDEFHIAFSGTFYSHLNYPDFLLQILEKAAEKSRRIHFHHVGNSAYDIQKLVKKYAPNISFTEWGYREHHECLKLLHQMDAFALILDERWPNAEKTAGGKIYEYLRFRKPVFALAPENGEAAQVLKNCQAGLVHSSRDILAGADKLHSIISGESTFSFNGIEMFSREYQAGLLDTYLTGIISS